MHTADVVIIGGGIIGASIAYHLRQEGETGRVMVIEQDATYARASTAMSLGGIRQLYGVPCNIAMARYSLQVYEQFDVVMAGDWGQPQAHFHQRGYCFIMTPENRDVLLRKYDVQRQMGVEVECLTPEQLQERIPAMRVDDLSGAIYGQRDGYLNPRGALQGYVERSRELGCTWLQDEVTGFTPGGSGASSEPTSTVYTRKMGAITTRALVLAAGPWTPHVAALAGLDLPVQPVRRQACEVIISKTPREKLPMIIDANDIHFRPHTEFDDHMLATHVVRDEPPGLQFVWDPAQFDDHMGPHLQRRLPGVGPLQLQRGWAGHYVMTPDENPILGEHPTHPGLYLAVGLSGHGVMLAPAVGKVLAEIICQGRSVTLDARPYRLERFATGDLIPDAQI